MIKLVDAFIFYNELELLNYRLNLLNEVVDYFVLVESTHTFAGNEKILYYNENKHLFESFANKIIHIIVDDMPHKHSVTEYNQGWVNEAWQRNAISRGIKQIADLSPEDIIAITDVDEILDPRTMWKIKRGEIDVAISNLDMELYYYNLNYKLSNHWSLPKIMQHRLFLHYDMNCEYVRSKLNNLPCIPHGGWHLSYFGDKHFIKNKIQNFSHQEFNNEEYTNLDKIEDRMNNYKDLYGRAYFVGKLNIEENEYLPIDYQLYLKNYYA